MSGTPDGKSILEAGLRQVQAQVDALPAGVTRAFILKGDSARGEVRLGIVLRDAAKGWHVAADLGIAKQDGFSVRGTVIKEF